MRLAQKPVPYSQLMARTVTRELKRIGRRSCSSLLCMEVKLHLQLWQEEGGDPSDYDERDEDSILSLSQYLLPTHCLERTVVQRNPWPMGPWWSGSSSSPEPCGIAPSALVVDRNLKYHNKNMRGFKNLTSQSQPIRVSTLWIGMSYSFIFIDGRLKFTSYK